MIWDTVTEMRFTTPADYAAFCAVIADAKIMAALRADEARFLDDTKRLRFTVQEHASTPAPRAAVDH
jgi:hypothetical protein